MKLLLEYGADINRSLRTHSSGLEDVSFLSFWSPEMLMLMDCIDFGLDSKSSWRCLPTDQANSVPLLLQRGLCVDQVVERGSIWMSHINTASELSFLVKEGLDVDDCVLYNKVRIPLRMALAHEHNGEDMVMDAISDRRTHVFNVIQKTDRSMTERMISMMVVDFACPQIKVPQERLH
jgi:hypothetical protein